jgi:hypothetical protein
MGGSLVLYGIPSRTGLLCCLLTSMPYFCGSRFIATTPSSEIYTLQFATSPKASSHFALHRESEGDPFSDLYVDTSHYSTLGEVILLGDFNARTRNLQISLHDRGTDTLCLQELEPESVGLHRCSQDKYGPLTGYGRHLLQLGESHDLLIMNGPLCG